MRPCCTRAHLPQAVTHRATKRHAHWPAVLNAHEVEAHGSTIGIVQAAQPVPHDFSPALRAVKHDGNLAGTVNRHSALYNGHVPYNVHARNSNRADKRTGFANRGAALR
jgi:hypothetical protein